MGTLSKQPTHTSIGVKESRDLPEPSVFHLPQNPMRLKSFKCNFIKSRVEYNRIGQVV
jgi:hypothetical protein